MDLSGHEGEIPIPMSNSYVVHGPSTRPTTATLNNTEEESGGGGGALSNSKKTSVLANKLVKYRECLKNHAASMGGNATDGCGEFMPSGEEGTIEALKCSACSCHRNFHRKEVEGEQQQLESYYHLKGQRINAAYGYSLARSAAAPPAMIMPLGAAMHNSESDEMEEVYGHGGGMMMMAGGGALPMGVKKRFRTKFTQEQKEKMLLFADRVGWRLQRQEESLVQQFCQEIGVRRRVLKVWMHNNKHNLGKKNSSTSSPLQLQ